MIATIFTLLLAAASGVAVSDDPPPPKYQPGDRVVVVRTAELKVPAGAVDEVWPGLVVKGGGVNDKGLWVSNGKPGWIDQNAVVPLGQAAIARMNELIAASPDNARLFSGRAAV